MEKLNSNLPIVIKAGKLSLGGGLSKLNSPVLSSSVSPFSNASTSVNGITGTLAASSGISKSNSLFLQYNFPLPHIGNKIKKIQTAAIIDRNCYGASFYADWALANKIRLSTASVFGIFELEEKIPATWYLNKAIEQYFHTDKIYSQNFQFNFTSRIYSGNLIFNFYNSPFGEINFALKNENKISLNKTTINFGEFYCHEDLLTSSQKKVEAQLQLKSGIQHKFIICLPVNHQIIPIFIKSGINNYFYYDLYQKTILKTSAGISFTANNYSEIITGAVTINFPEISYINLQSKFNFLIKNSKNSLTTTVNFTSSQNQMEWNTYEKFSLSSSINNNFKLTSTETLSLTQKNQNSTKVDFTWAINSKFYYKQLEIQLKLQIKIP